MANKRPKPEEIVTKLRQAEVLVGRGNPASGRDPADWRDLTDVVPLKEEVRWNGQRPIEGAEAAAGKNEPLCKAVSGLTLDNVDLGRGSNGKLLSPARATRKRA